MLEINVGALVTQAVLGLAYLALVITALVLVLRSRFSAPAKVAWALGIWLIPLVGAVASLVAVSMHSRKGLREP